MMNRMVNTLMPAPCRFKHWSAVGECGVGIAEFAELQNCGIVCRCSESAIPQFCIPQSAIRGRRTTMDFRIQTPTPENHRQEVYMRLKLVTITCSVAILLSLAAGCSQQRANTPAAKDQVEKALKLSGMDKINVDEDRDKGVITLKGD